MDARHRPPARVIGAVAFAVVVAVSYDFTALFTALILSLVMALSARLNLGGGCATACGAGDLSAAAVGGAALVV
jgi:hypothetical protein